MPSHLKRIICATAFGAASAVVPPYTGGPTEELTHFPAEVHASVVSVDKYVQWMWWVLQQMKSKYEGTPVGKYMLNVKFHTIANGAIKGVHKTIGQMQDRKIALLKSLEEDTKAAVGIVKQQQAVTTDKHLFYGYGKMMTRMVLNERLQNDVQVYFTNAEQKKQEFQSMNMAIDEQCNFVRIIEQERDTNFKKLNRFGRGINAIQNGLSYFTRGGISPAVEQEMTGDLAMHGTWTSWKGLTRTSKRVNDILQDDATSKAAFESTMSTFIQKTINLRAHKLTDATVADVVVDRPKIEVFHRDFVATLNTDLNEAQQHSHFWRRFKFFTGFAIFFGALTYLVLVFFTGGAILIPTAAVVGGATVVGAGAGAVAQNKENTQAKIGDHITKATNTATKPDWEAPVGVVAV